MSPRARRSLVVVAALACGLAAGTLLLAPGEAAICEHMLEVARASGEDLERAGVDEAYCHDAVRRRRAKMGLVRRAGYGICVVMADTLDEIGRC